MIHSKNHVDFYILTNKNLKRHVNDLFENKRDTYAIRKYLLILSLYVLITRIIENRLSFFNDILIQ